MIFAKGSHLLVYRMKPYILVVIIIQSYLDVTHKAQLPKYLYFTHSKSMTKQFVFFIMLVGCLSLKRINYLFWGRVINWPGLARAILQKASWLICWQPSFCRKRNLWNLCFFREVGWCFFTTFLEERGSIEMLEGWQTDLSSLFLLYWSNKEKLTLSSPIKTKAS